MNKNYLFFLATVISILSACTPANPDSRQISFISCQYQSNRWNCGIDLINADGSNLNRLTAAVNIDSRMAWSPDGRQLAFSCIDESSGNDSEICLIEADGTHFRRVTDDNLENQYPAWSGDGTKLVFVSSSYADAEAGIYIMDADGANLRLVENSLYNAHQVEADHADYAKSNIYRHPVWSADSRQIAFVFLFDIYIMNSDGTELSSLNTRETYKTLAWSPNGELFAFEGISLSSSSRIYTMNVNGSNVTELITDTSKMYMDVSWSFDGTQLVFIGLAGNSDQIYLADLDGTNLRQITNLSDSIDISNPVMRPDSSPVEATESVSEEAD